VVGENGLDDVDRQALATACGVAAAVFIALSMGLSEPYWATLSVMIISNVDRDALFTKGVLRIVGTLVGVFGGYLASQWIEGQPLQQAALVLLAAGIGTFGRQRSAYGYAWFYGALTFMLIQLYTMTTPQGLYEFAHYRCYEIVIGVVCGTTANWAVGPRRGELPGGLKQQPIATSEDNAAWQAFIAGLGALAILVMWTQWNLPQLPQVLISSLIIIDADPAATRHRGVQRIFGCILGGAVGLLVILIDAADVWWWGAALFLGVFFFARLHLGPTSNAYIGTQSAIAYLVTLVGSGPPTSIAPPIDRLVGIVLGVSIMTALVWALNARRRTPSAA
jgi:uncharacterized membrane protein YccC